MGVNKLKLFIMVNAPKGIKRRKISSYKYRKLKCLVEAMQTMYTYGISIREKYNGDMTNSQGKVTSHIYTFSKRTSILQNGGILPVFVFDGKPPDVKKKQMAKRKEGIKKAEENLKKAIIPEDIIKNLKKSYKIEYSAISESRAYLDSMGIPNIKAPGEAEAQCASIMIHDKSFYATITDDSDALLFGARKIISNYHGSGNKYAYEIDLEDTLNGICESAQKIVLTPSRKYEIDCYDVSEEILESYNKFLLPVNLLERLYEYKKTLEKEYKLKLDAKMYKKKIEIFTRLCKLINNKILEQKTFTIKEFTQDNFIELCILFGTDYCPHINGLNNDILFIIFTLCKFNVEETIESIRESKLAHIPLDFYEDLMKAKTEYKEAKVYNPEKLDLDIKLPKKEEMYNIMHVANEFDTLAVEQRYKQLVKFYNKHEISNEEKEFKSFKSYQQKYMRMKAIKIYNYF